MGGGGVYGSAQINFTKVYVANVISVTRGGNSSLSRKRCYITISVMNPPVMNPPVTIQVIHAKII